MKLKSVLKRFEREPDSAPPIHHAATKSHITVSGVNPYMEACRKLVMTLFTVLAYLMASSVIATVPAFAEEPETQSIEVSELPTNPYSSKGEGHFIRVTDTETHVAYCAQGQLVTPAVGQKLTRYGELDIPELDYVLYHGYDGTAVTSIFGLDEQKSEAATTAAVWLAIAEKREDILTFTPASGEPFHGNKMYLERWEMLPNQQVKDAAWKLYTEAREYAKGSQDGDEQGTAILWTNETAYEGDGSLGYQYLVTAEKHTTVTLHKQSEDASTVSGNPAYSLEGATYEISRPDTGEIVATVTTDANGMATCSLELNTSYAATEVTPSAGYLLNTSPVEFTTGTEPKQVELFEQPITVTVSLSKRDAATNGAPQPGLSLEGAEYTLTSATGAFTTKAATDENGSAQFSKVPLGDISIAETKAPEGYLADTTVHNYTITEDQASELNYTLHIEHDFQDVPIAFDIEIDKQLTTSDPADSDHILAGANITFQVISNTSGKTVGTLTTDENGHASSESTWMGDGERPQNASGSIPFDPKGYTVHEDPSTTPDGYAALDDWTIDASEIANGAKLHFDIVNEAVTSRLQILKIDAESRQPVPMAGFTFTILASDGSPVADDSWYPEAPEKTTFTTDETGSAALPAHLLAGSYLIHETSAPAPYILNSNDTPLEISDSGLSKTVVTVSDQPARGIAHITKTCSADGQPLAGAVFNVVAREDIVSPTGHVQAMANEIVDTVITDEEGKASTDPLPLGSGSAPYAFVEIEAPAGHVLNDDPISFTLSYRDQQTGAVSTSVEAADEPTCVKLVKTASGDNASPVAGATFTLSRIDKGEQETPADSETEERGESEESSEDAGVTPDTASEGPEDEPGEGEEAESDQTDKESTETDDSSETEDRDSENAAEDNVADTFTTDENGSFEILHLDEGTYELVETDAPDGYVVDSTPIQFSVDERGFINGNSTLEVKVENGTTTVEFSKRDSDDESFIEGARLELLDSNGDSVDAWTTQAEPHRILGLAPGDYRLVEVVSPRSYEEATAVDFTVEATEEVQQVTMYDQPITIQGAIDKRQGHLEDIDGEDTFDYTIDMRNESSTWVDEFTVTDTLSDEDGSYPELESLTTPKVQGDYDGLLNVWYQSSASPELSETSAANATLDDGHVNPWLNEETVLKGIGCDRRGVNFSEWHLWKEGVSTDIPETLDVEDLGLQEGERITAVRLEFGRVEENFTSREGDWDREDLRSESDYISDETKTDSGLAPAVLHIDAESVASAPKVNNSASVDLYRNGGGGGLEGHDTDRVSQSRSTVVGRPLDQTGAALICGSLLAAAACSLGIVAVLHPRGPIQTRSYRRRMQ